MNKQMKFALVGIIIVLLSACGQVGPVSTPAQDVVGVKNSPPAVPVTGLAPEKFSQYIGLNYPPLPEGLSDDFSMLIQDAEDYSMWLISEGENKMLWLSKMTHRDSNGNAYWEVKDILDLSDLEAGLTLIPDGCSLNGLPDSEILVVGRDEVAVSAWRANTALNVFEVIPTDGIECHSDKGMILE